MAFANAAMHVFATIIIRLMCFAHVYKASHFLFLPFSFRFFISCQGQCIFVKKFPLKKEQLTCTFVTLYFSFFMPLQSTEKYAKKIVDADQKGQFMQDINAISYAWTPEAAVILKNLFFLKWEAHANPQVRDATAHFRTEWCNERVGNWSCGHSRNSVMNTNGLEATNEVIKDELTFRQLMPVLDFLQRALLWLRERRGT